ncbi:MAG: threonine synthase [Cyanobacteria bacterium]|nr:threonine synthase [Cyanobacteriota bacterium]
MAYQGTIQKYSKYLSVNESTPIISIQEGNTPLVPAPHIAGLTGVKDLKVYLKIEGLNPTGSFKDRGMTMAVTKAVEKGATRIICASTGNTSASAAAFAARARGLGYEMDCFVIIPAGYVALGKLSQAMIYGAKVIQIEGNFDVALDIVKDLCDKYPIELVNSLNPYRIEGQKTSAYEICDELGDAPDYLCIPVGNAGNITAYWAGFSDYKKAHKKPKMYGFQAAGAAPIVDGAVVANPETIGTAIRIGNPASWKQAEAARDQSGGLIDKVTDDEMLAAYRVIHSSEGYACEPASAASVAGLIKAAKAGKIEPGSTVVCVLTGNGLKDPKVAMEQSDMASAEKIYKSEIKDVAKALGLS